MAFPRFKSPAIESTFFAAYDAVLARWPVPVDSIDVPSGYGTTRVQVCGPAEGLPLVLLHGGMSTATVWFANVADLSVTHRVYAVDQIGDVGRSVHDGQPIRSVDDFMGWLDGLLAHLGLTQAALCGHSYGAWLALNYTLHSPGRVGKLILLDPTTCFAGLNFGYRIHAIPLFARPSAQRVRAFLHWETDGAALDPAWLALAALAGGEARGSKLIVAKRPAEGRLRASTVPTLVVLAQNSKAHDASQVAANALRLMPRASTATLTGATHHTMPTLGAPALNRTMLDFLA